MISHQWCSSKLQIVMCFETSRTQCVLMHATKKTARAVGLGCVEVFPIFTSEMFVKIDGLNITVALIFFW